MKTLQFLMTAYLVVAGMVATYASTETLLRDDWRFSRDGARWQQVTVPHDWAIAGPFDKKWDLQIVAIKENGEDVATEHTGRSGALPWVGSGVYQRTFTVPAGTERALLVFDGAMASPKVFVNGKQAGGWEYGYNAFQIDITPFIHRDGSDNSLEVRLTNREESSRWYPGGGLYRPVTLVTSAADALDLWGLAMSTAAVDANGQATIDVRHRLPAGSNVANATLDVTIFDANGQQVAHGTSPADGTGAFHLQAPIPNAHLWSPETPYLYRSTITLLRGGKAVDTQHTRLGVRTISFSRDGGFRLNGVQRKIKGVCLHHDLGPIGAALNKAALTRQIKIMKDMGADAIRTSHNMPSQWQMDLCDSLGMMVMAESFDCWSDPKVRNGYNLLWDEWWQRDITNLIEHHRNHPSIIMWSVGNEIPEQWKTEGAGRYRALVALCHQLDPTRPVTCGMDQPDADIKSGFAMMADVPGYNYRVHRYEATFDQLPQGFLLGSETASTISSRGNYFFPDTCATNTQWPEGRNGQCSSYDVDHCWWSNLPDDDWRLQDDMPWTVGEFVWTGFDYLGEPTPYDSYWPSRSSYYGICDLAGLPKDRYWLYRSHWNTQAHTLHLLPHWTWPDRKGKVTPVYCYTDYPSAELFVNGKSQGRLTKDPSTRLDRYRLRWRNVRYEPGELRVVAYDNNGNKAAEHIVRTAGKPARLSLTADRTQLSADGDDLAFVTVALTDNKGTLCPDADNSLSFEVKGAGTYRGACNGDATSLEPFTEPTMRLFHGQLVVVVQAAQRAGKLTLTVRDRNNGLKQSITIPVQ